MKQRIISAVIALAIFVPIFIMGGIIYNIAIFILGILGLKEFLDIMNEKKSIPLFIQFISYIFLPLLIFSCTSIDPKVFMIDFRILVGLFLLLLIPVILYHDFKVYSINDAFYLIGGNLFIGISFLLLILLRSISLNYIIYLFTITITTDVFAFLAGSLIGKNKLLPMISPGKTWEGSIVGSFMGTVLGSMFFLTVISTSLESYFVILITLFLSVIGQFGDLCFSSIKRYFEKKDFSNIMPGHGGILDRLDSIIFVVLAFTFFMTLI